MVRNFLSYVVKSLVDNPEQVEINEIEGEKAIIVELKVAPEDVGRVIGKQGKVIKAIRLLVNAASVKLNKRITVEILG